MNTRELAAECGVHKNTILRLFNEGLIKSGYPVGGKHGHEFKKSAIDQVQSALSGRHQRRVKELRRNRTERNPFAKKGSA